MTVIRLERAKTAGALLVAALVATTWAERARSADLVELFGLPTLDSLKVTVDRPLFVRGRRPPAVAPEIVEAEPVVVPSEDAPAELTGIVVSPERTYALLTRVGNQETELVRQGQVIDDWSVEEIGSRHVILRRGASRMRLELFDQKDKESSSRRGGDGGRPAFRSSQGRAGARTGQRSQAQRRPANRRPSPTRSRQDDD
jgi:hypothetical protein